MPVREELLRGLAATGGGHVDYRLARNALVSEFHKGRLAKHEVCDAHPELVRAARNVATPTEQDCPICDEAKIVLVTYAFGNRLPASGRCITSGVELARLTRVAGELACYVVEVCPTCSWNHLARSFTATKARRAKAT